MTRDLFRSTLAETIALHQQVMDGDTAPLFAAVAAITGAVTASGKVLLFGNGGSAADAQHVAAELVGRFARERRAIAAIALTADTSVVTAVGNDYAYDRVFARQVEALGVRGDVAIGISTSGGSANVVAGLDAAGTRGLTTIALTGCDGGAVARAAAIHINVPSSSTARVQEVHRTLLHVICDLVEQSVA